MEESGEKRLERWNMEMSLRPLVKGNQVVFRDSAPHLPLVSRIMFGTEFDYRRVYTIEAVHRIRKGYMVTLSLDGIRIGHAISTVFLKKVKSAPKYLKSQKPGIPGE